MKPLCPICRSERPMDMGYHLIRKHRFDFTYSTYIHGTSMKCPCGFETDILPNHGYAAVMNAHLTTDHIIALAVEQALKEGPQ